MTTATEATIKAFDLDPGSICASCVKLYVGYDKDFILNTFHQGHATAQADYAWCIAPKSNQILAKTTNVATEVIATATKGFGKHGACTF